MRDKLYPYPKEIGEFRMSREKQRPQLMRIFILALLAFSSGALAQGKPASIQHGFGGSETHNRYLLPDSTKIERIIIKFKERTGVRLRSGRLISEDVMRLPPGLEIARVRRNLRSITGLLLANELAIKRTFTSLGERELEAYVRRGRNRTGRPLRSLTLYYAIPLSRNPRFDAIYGLVKRLNAFPVVAVAYAEPITRPATHLSTSNFQSDQGYLDAAPNGIDAFYAWSFPGGRGDEVRIVDVEYAWNPNHEDLPNFFFDSGAYTGLPNDHGTAVAGVIVADDNGYGITGIVPNASFGVQTISGGISTADAILSAADAVGPGGIVLIELHRPGPEQGGDCSCNQSQCHYIPVEYWDAEFAAIQAATSNGVIVVEAAGNGSADLDDSVYGNRFDRSYRDSGAIIVGASESHIRAPTCWTNFGSRVDVHGWGENVVTLGYGDLFSGGHLDGNQLYTQSFSGTSSASPIVVGAVASIQGIALAEQGAPMGPFQMRQLITETGTSQVVDLGRHIGPLPDLVAAIENIPTITNYAWLPAVHYITLN